MSLTSVLKKGQTRVLYTVRQYSMYLRGCKGSISVSWSVEVQGCSTLQHIVVVRFDLGNMYCSGVTIGGGNLETGGFGSGKDCSGSCPICLYLVTAYWFGLQDPHSVSHIDRWSFLDSSVMPALGYEVSPSNWSATIESSSSR